MTGQQTNYNAYFPSHIFVYLNFPMRFFYSKFDFDLKYKLEFDPIASSCFLLSVTSESTSH